jgi:divalent metal cation (Fe/Co/Zn/Cd) transporter
MLHDEAGALPRAGEAPGAAPSDRPRVRAAVRVEIFTTLWMAAEAGLSIGAGIAAGSLLLVAFGLDSVLELVSGGMLLWRLSVEARGASVARVERAERQAIRVVAVCLALLCAYVLASAVYGLVAQARPERSPIGIGVSAAALVVMPLLGVTKRRLAARLDSGALRGDAASGFTCAYMAATVLAGLVLNALFAWWWAEYVAALVFLIWLVAETREAIEEARAGAEGV